MNIPWLGTVSCGQPLFAEENIKAFVPVSKKLMSPSHTYFLLTAHGDSMDQKGIHDGDLILLQQKQTAESGELILALINDEASIKEYAKHDQTVILYPRSTNPVHQPIILTNDLKIQGVVQQVIPL
ncbi:LexA family protein [Gangjinia marincola]|uniref:LexA family protein n=1 Tax=Gangjinia marincola TaxID=578463 RepID=UPI0031CFACE7